MLIEMSIKGLMLDPITNMPIVLLRDAVSQRVLPIWVGPVEASAIALQVENVAPPRPMTHDLMRNLLSDLGVTLERVIISDLRDNTFYAFLELRHAGPGIRGGPRPRPGQVGGHFLRAGRPRSPAEVAGESRSRRSGLQDVVESS
jgi:bifunctional DNase/RNase